ncbi:4Fe-4S dicluster domain-containing protein [Lachnospiraceae bacterium KGMB03038]|nr:4Fe-4S dicluster domain-containing protein [Lachnospiraceae bacterium KGMB03038]
MFPYCFFSCALLNSLVYFTFLYYDRNRQKRDMSNNQKRRYIPMAHVISDECVSCGACEAECPVGAISQGADHYEIDADTCVDCGACAAQCPTGAISEG